MAIELLLEDMVMSHAAVFVPVLVVPSGHIEPDELRRTFEPAVEGSRVRLEAWRRSSPPIAILASASALGEASLRALGTRIKVGLEPADGSPWVVVGAPTRDRDAALAASGTLDDAAELARVTYNAPSVVLTSDVAAHAALLEAPRLLAVLRDVLQPFTRLPRGEDLLATLETLLESDVNVSHTAELLGVHRHTVALRMRRIRGILGMEPWTYPARMRFELALQARRLTTPRHVP